MSEDTATGSFKAKLTLSMEYNGDTINDTEEEFSAALQTVARKL